MVFSCESIVVLELNLLVMYKRTYESETVVGYYRILELLQTDFNRQDLLCHSQKLRASAVCKV